MKSRQGTSMGSMLRKAWRAAVEAESKTDLLLLVGVPLGAGIYIGVVSVNQGFLLLPKFWLGLLVLTLCWIGLFLCVIVILVLPRKGLGILLKILAWVVFFPLLAVAFCTEYLIPLDGEGSHSVFLAAFVGLAGPVLLGIHILAWLVPGKHVSAEQ